MFGSIISAFKIRKIRHEWRKMNSHNGTNNMNGFDYNRVSVGNFTYGELIVLAFNENNKLRIGNFCSIASDVVFSLSAEHSMKTISSFPFKTKCLGSTVGEARSKGDIIIDDDVWIGERAIILSGVHIGQGAVIAAGAVVNKDVKPYEIVGGVPARHISFRFSEDKISELITLDYSKLTNELIEGHLKELYDESFTNESLDWFPRKKCKGYGYEYKS